MSKEENERIVMCIFEGRAFQQAGTTRVKDPEAGACFSSLKDQHGRRSWRHSVSKEENDETKSRDLVFQPV